MNFLVGQLYSFVREQSLYLTSLSNHVFLPVGSWLANTLHSLCLQHLKERKKIFCQGQQEKNPHFSRIILYRYLLIFHWVGLGDLRPLTTYFLIVPVTFSTQDRWDGRKISSKQFCLEKKSIFSVCSGCHCEYLKSRAIWKVMYGMLLFSETKTKINSNFLEAFCLDCQGTFNYIGEKSFGEKKLSMYTLGISNRLLISRASYPWMSPKCTGTPKDRHVRDRNRF